MKKKIGRRDFIATASAAAAFSTLPIAVRHDSSSEQLFFRIDGDVRNVKYAKGQTSLFRTFHIGVQGIAGKSLQHWHGRTEHYYCSTIPMVGETFWPSWNENSQLISSAGTNEFTDVPDDKFIRRFSSFLKKRSSTRKLAEGHRYSVVTAAPILFRESHTALLTARTLKALGDRVIMVLVNPNLTSASLPGEVIDGFPKQEFLKEAQAVSDLLITKGPTHIIFPRSEPQELSFIADESAATIESYTSPMFTAFTPNVLETDLDFRTSRYDGMVRQYLIGGSSRPRDLALGVAEWYFRKNRVYQRAGRDTLYFGIDAGNDELRWEAFDVLHQKMTSAFSGNSHIIGHFDYCPDFLANNELMLSALLIKTRKKSSGYGKPNGMSQLSTRDY